MFKNPKVQAALVLAVGVLLGYGAASGKMRLNWSADAAPGNRESATSNPADSTPATQQGACCTDGDPRSVLLG
jgi:hypothetical protein